jgi:glycosyltransferase involved in cell wall biosynthesis
MSHIPKFAILIPTRNRPSQITKLLESLLVSTLKPLQIIIIASGEDIINTVGTFVGKLPVTYQHTKVTGQVNQKKEGLRLLADESEWVIFLDDDLLVTPDTFATAFSTFLEQSKLSSEPILGIGLKITPTARIQTIGCFGQVLSRIFVLSSNTPGVILKSAQAVSYLHETSPVCTEWLNGASIWRKDSAIAYGYVTTSSIYAAYEDIVFSYPQSKLGRLIFSPNSILVFQDNNLTDFEAKHVYESAAYLRMSFALSTSELSPILCAWSQVGRSFFAAKEKGFTNFKYIYFLHQINWRLFLVAINLKRIESLLSKIRT